MGRTLLRLSRNGPSAAALVPARIDTEAALLEECQGPDHLCRGHGGVPSLARRWSRLADGLPLIECNQGIDPASNQSHHAPRSAAELPSMRSVC